jgi:hypothetical protein
MASGGGQLRDADGRASRRALDFGPLLRGDLRRLGERDWRAEAGDPLATFDGSLIGR